MAEYDTVHVVPIALEDGFLTLKMKERTMEHAENLSITFVPAFNYDPVLKEIHLDHMKAGEDGSSI